jgi:transcriptional regulator with XRE-family HTH domain
MSVFAGTRVPYRLGVPAEAIDRQAWAALVQATLDADFDGNQSRFAAAAGVTAKTVGRWLKQQHDVSEQSVRDAARRLDRDPFDWLVRIGYYTQQEAPRRDPPRLQTPLGQFVLERMARAGLRAAEDLAEAAGLPVDQVTTIVFGPALDIDPDVFDRLADALHVNVKELSDASSAAVPQDATDLPDELVGEVDAMLRSDSPLTDAERRSLRAFLELALEPYRQKYGQSYNDCRAS